MKASHRDRIIEGMEWARREGKRLTTPGPESPDKVREAYGGDPLTDEQIAFVNDPSRCVRDSMSFYFQPVSWRAAPDVPITQCDPNAEGIGADAFTARPLGSPAVADASVEYRFAVWGPLKAAVFLDGAVLPSGDDAFFTLDDNFMALTPGFGVRYMSPVGPIRVDVGINPGGAELAVLGGREAGPAGGVLGVGDDEIQLFGGAQ